MRLRKKDKICSSLYHRWWFRTILFIVGVDMLIFGILFAFNVDIISIVPEMNGILHLIIGLMYIIVSIYIIHLVLNYRRIKKETHFVCHYCGHINR